MTDYIDWRSNLSLEKVFSSSVSISYPHAWDHGVLYLSTLPAEQGRVVVMFLRDQKTECLTPKPFNLRSQFSEYGGKPYWLIDDHLIFVNHADQCLYRQNLCTSESPIVSRISPKPSNAERLMYAEVLRVSAQYLLLIVEREHQGENSESESRSFIGVIDLSDATRAVTVVEQGADFYSNLCFDRGSNKVAWVQWDHPNMPWDETQLWLADLEPDQSTVQLQNAQQVALPDSASVCQLLFAANGKLFFSADFAAQKKTSSRNFWNIYAIDPQQRKLQKVSVTQGLMEFGYPHWQYGDARIIQFDANNLLTIASQQAGDILYTINQNSFEVTELDDSGLMYQNLSSGGDGCAMAVNQTATKPPVIVEIRESANRFSYISMQSNPLSKDNISVAEHFEFPTKDGQLAFGYYYPPTNSDYQFSDSQRILPPMIVMVHGGPTARAYGCFDIQKQFWTQRGFAVFDVNHRGSSGYGRVFRDALYGNWGELDIRDIIDGIEYLVLHSKVDRKRICIRGKSAGGYAVLRALTEFPEVFRAGACYYGIGNLVTLAETTHKFEKHYADRLIGEAYQPQTAAKPESLFQQRSPINSLKQLKSAMIVFQGLQDKIVPPIVAHEIINTLKVLGIKHSYVEYADEGHGFRQAATNIDAWAKELKFYQQNLR